MPSPVLFVSGNAGKVREVASFLGRPITQIDVDLDEIQAVNVADVARHKAVAAYALTGRRLLVEDTGLGFAGLNGLPGALIKWFVRELGPAGIAAMLPDGASRAATARTAVALADGDGVTVVTGAVRGTITSAPRGSGGFGWDAVFQPDGQPPGSEQTFAEMDEATKNRFSMRRIALEQIVDRLGE